MNKKELVASLKNALDEINLIRECQNELITDNYWNDIVYIQETLNDIQGHAEYLIKEEKGNNE